MNVLTERYRLAAAAGGVGIWDWNLETGEMYVDPVLKQLLGYEDHEIRNHLDDWGRLVYPDDAARVFERAQAHINGSTATYDVEHRMVHRDGSIRWFHARGSVTRDAHGTAVRMVGTDTDITERKRGEEALQQAEEINRRIVQSTGDCVKILALDGTIIFVNPEGLHALELTSPESLLFRKITDFFESAVRVAADRAVARARAGERGRFQGMLRTASGQAKWWDVVITPITNAVGAVVQLLAISRDITERRREETFRAGQHRVLEMIAEGEPLLEVLNLLVHVVEEQAAGMVCSVLLLDEDGVHIRHGAAPSLPTDFVHSVNGLAIGPRTGSCGTAMFLGRPVVVTDILTDPLWDDYRDLPMSAGLRACWSTPIFSPQHKVLGSFAMYYTQPRAPTEFEQQLIETAAEIARIAIEQQRAREALSQSEARMQAILRAIPDWVFLQTADGVFLDFHGRDASHLHAPPSQFLGRNVRAVLPAPLGEQLGQAIARVAATGNAEDIEYTLPAADGVRFYEVSIVPCDSDKVLSMVRDMTDRKNAELENDAQRRELAHLSRVAMLGELSGALAHELSQPLAAVLINAQAAQIIAGRPSIDVAELRLALDDIIKNDKRAGKVIDRLRALLRKSDTAFQLVDVNEVVREVLDLTYGELLSRRITVTSNLTAETPVVLGDRIQLQQVLLNLVLNACDALSETPLPERRIQLSTARQNGFVRLAVADRGCGLPPGQLENVFNPFVTFREKGLGLGLAITRSIMIAHGGSIRAEHNADGGATFRCQWPVAPAAG